jgi:uncharacterized spore protein YtfJ
MEDKIIVPITKMGMGFGTGSSQCGDNKKAGGTSGGAGGGVGVFPLAVVIVTKGVSGHEGVKVVPLGTPNALAEVNGRDSISAHGKIQQKEGIQRREAR